MIHIIIYVTSMNTTIKTVQRKTITSLKTITIANNINVEFYNRPLHRSKPSRTL